MCPPPTQNKSKRQPLCVVHGVGKGGGGVSTQGGDARGVGKVAVADLACRAPPQSGLPQREMIGPLVTSDLNTSQQEHILRKKIGKITPSPRITASDDSLPLCQILSSDRFLFALFLDEFVPAFSSNDGMGFSLHVFRENFNFIQFVVGKFCIEKTFVVLRVEMYLLFFRQMRNLVQS